MIARREDTVAATLAPEGVTRGRVGAAVGVDDFAAGCSPGSTRVDVECAHCGLPVPAGLVEPGESRQFCCHGCRTVYGLIAATGLSTYYRVRDAAPGAAQAARSTGRDYTECDDPAYGTAFVRALADGTRQTTFLVEGVHCAACVWLIERLGRTTPGVVESRLDFQRSTATVRWDPHATRLSAIARGLDRLGYPAHPPKGVARDEFRRREDRRYLGRVGVAGFLAGNVMLLAFALYGGLFADMQPVFRQTFRWLSAALGVLSLAWPGRVFFTSAWSAFRAKALNLDVPIAAALLVGGLGGAWNTVRGSGEIYFESLAMLVFLLLVGRWIQHGQQRRAGSAVELLFMLTPTRARLVEADTDGTRRVRTVPIEGVSRGDVVEVLAGDSVPADGVVAAGASSVDESLLTGESAPVPVAVGSAVSAGAVNISGAIDVRVVAAGEEARVAKLMALVAEGASRRAPIVRFADRIAAVFVVVVVVLAALTAGVWAVLDPAHALDHATALLIVSCPCALGLATPLVLTTSIGRLARRGVLVKGGDALEALARPGRIVLDKTGTLTEGGLQVVRVVGDRSVLPRVVRLEQVSAHPVARAIVRWASEAGVLPADRAPSKVVQTTGAGVRGVFGAGDGADGIEIVVGTEAFVRSHAGAADSDGIGLTERDIASIVSDAAALALSPVLIAHDGVIVAGIAMGDRVRDEARGALAELRERGWALGVASGDRAEVVRAVAGTLGIDDAHGGMSPEDKLDLVRAATSADSRSRPRLVMVGDGVNDAAALAAADVGIAVHGGAEASLEAADIAIQSPGLTPLVELFAESRSALRRIHVCFAASVCYNAAGVMLAMAGLVNPLLAAILMPVSSLTVLAIATRGGHAENGSIKGGRTLWK